jgi:hypothetical protein
MRFTLAIELVAVGGLAFGTSCGVEEAPVAGETTNGSIVADSSDVTAPLGPGNTSNEAFCDAMDHLIVLLAPSGRTSPAETQADFEEAIVWFAEAAKASPPAIADDVARYSAAYGEYVEYLRAVGFNLDRVFSTDEGRQLAIDTSHTLTPAIVDHVTDSCGLTFDAEPSG